MTMDDERTSMYRQHEGAVMLLRATLADGGIATLPLGPRPIELTVGRHPSCDWQLADATVSRRHALLRWSGRELSIEDLGSTGGTSIDERRLGAGEERLTPGQRVSLGDATLELELAETWTAPASGDDETLASDKTLVTIANPLDEETLILVMPPVAAVAAQPHPAPVIVSAELEQLDSVAADAQGPVFMPARDALDPRDETRSWPVEAALARLREPLFSLPRLSSLFARRPKPPVDEKREPTEPIPRKGRRPRLVVVAGPALLALVSGASAFGPRPEAQAAPVPPAAAAPRRPRAAPPAMRAPSLPVATPAAPQLPAPEPPAAPDERDAALAGAIHAYKNGDRTQALLRFRQLARDPSDPTAKFMARLVELQQASEGQ